MTGWKRCWTIGESWAMQWKTSLATWWCLKPTTMEREGTRHGRWRQGSSVRRRLVIRRQCLLSYEEKNLENAWLEAGKQRLEDGGCRVAETCEFAEWASTAKMGEKAAFWAQHPSHPYTAPFFLRILTQLVAMFISTSLRAPTSSTQCVLVPVLHSSPKPLVVASNT